MSDSVDELERRFTDAATTSAWRSAQDSANELRDIARDAIALAKRQRKALVEIKTTVRTKAFIDSYVFHGPRAFARLVQIADTALQGQGTDDGKTQ